MSSKEIEDGGFAALDLWSAFYTGTPRYLRPDAMPQREHAYRVQHCRNCLQLVQGSDGRLAPEEAERLRKVFNEGRGTRVAGFKLGATSQEARDVLKTDRPVYGTVFAESAVPDGAKVRKPLVQRPIVEAEIAFILGKVPQDRPLLTPQDLIRSIEYVAPALEIPDPRSVQWPPHAHELIADNVAAGIYVLGSPVRRLADLPLKEIEMYLYANDELVAQGVGANSMGNPLNACLWLSHELAQMAGSPDSLLDDLLAQMASSLGPSPVYENMALERASKELRANACLREGQVILSGSLGRPFFAEWGTTYRAEFSGLGSVSLHFGE